jgi:molybdopterin converting factor subunit 1
MKVTVRYFQSLRRSMGTSSETVLLPDGANLGNLIEQLDQRNGELSRLAPSLLFAVNQEHAGRDSPLADGDEVAIMPPFSGG